MFRLFWLIFHVSLIKSNWAEPKFMDAVGRGGYPVAQNLFLAQYPNQTAIPDWDDMRIREMNKLSNLCVLTWYSGRSPGRIRFCRVTPLNKEGNYVELLVRTKTFQIDVLACTCQHKNYLGEIMDDDILFWITRGSDTSYFKMREETILNGVTVYWFTQYVYDVIPYQHISDELFFYDSNQ